MSRRAPPSRSALFAFAAVVLLTLGVYVASPVVTRTDSEYVLYGALSLVRFGDLDLDEYRPELQMNFNTRRSPTGHTYGYFPYGTEILVAPLLLATDHASTHLLGVDLHEVVIHQPSFVLERFYAALFTALAMGVLFLVGREVTGRTLPAFVVALIAAFCTPAWSTASRALWSHTPAMLLLSVALLCFVKARREPLWAAVAALPLAMAVVVRPTAALSLVAFSALMLQRRHRPYAVPFFTLGGLVAVAFALYNQVAFDSVLPPYFTNRFVEPGSAVALPGHLVSPARGLFVYSPVLALSLAGAAMRLRRRRPLDIALLCVLVAHWLMISRFVHWWGGFCYGPRLFADVVPYFGYFLLPVIERCLPAPGTLRLSRAGAAALTLALLSAVMHGRGALDEGGFDWNAGPGRNVDQAPGRIWDWRDPPFLRGVSWVASDG